MSFRQKKNQNLKDNINISSLIAQDNRTNPLLHVVYQSVNWATTDRKQEGQRKEQDL